MNERLEHILELESVNTDRIHLFSLPGEGEWNAYEQSAVNLQMIVPEVGATLADVVFPEAEIILRRVLLSLEQTERYELPLICTLLGNDYIELSPTEPPCDDSLPDTNIHTHEAGSTAYGKLLNK